MNEQVTAVDDWSASADDLGLRCRKYASLRLSHWRGEEAEGLSTNSHSSGMLGVGLGG